MKPQPPPRSHAAEPLHKPHFSVTAIEKAGIALALLIICIAIFARTDTAPLAPLTPLENATTYETRPVFTWSGKAMLLQIDDNPSFTTPLTLNVTGARSASPAQALETKTHYWKLIGQGETEARAINIVSKASLEVEKTSGGTLLKNTGNVDLRVIVDAVRDFGAGITGALIVPAGTNRLLPAAYPEKIEAHETDE